MPETLEKLAAAIGSRLRRLEWKLVTAESCTGGRLGAAITTIPGSSGWYDRGFIVYNNASKEELLGVNPHTLIMHGPVSEQIVREMAKGALQHAKAHVSLAITGIAGPGGASSEMPVGTIWLGWSSVRGATGTLLRLCPGSREHIRIAAVRAALEELLAFLEASP